MGPRKWNNGDVINNVEIYQTELFPAPLPVHMSVIYLDIIWYMLKSLSFPVYRLSS